MTARGFAEVSLKLIGGYWVVVALLSVPSVVSSYLMAAPTAQIDRRTWVVASWLGVVLYLAIGVTVLSYAERLADWIAPSEALDGKGPNDPQAMQGIAFSVLGAYFVVFALSSTAQHIYSFAALRDHADAWQYKDVLSREWSGVVATLTELVAGLVLFLGAKPLARLWHELRSRATHDYQEETMGSPDPAPEESGKPVE